MRQGRAALDSEICGSALAVLSEERGSASLRGFFTQSVAAPKSSFSNVLKYRRGFAPKGFSGSLQRDRRIRHFQSHPLTLQAIAAAIVPIFRPFLVGAETSVTIGNNVR